MKRMLVAVIAGGLLLGGCGGGQQAAAPTTTVTPPNAAACTAFAVANNDLVSLSYNGKGTMTLDQWKQAKNDAVRNIDRASLQAQGAVKERIDTLVAQLPADTLKLVLTDSPSGRSLVTNEDRVDNACQADGHPVTIKRLTVVGSSDILGHQPGS